MNFKTTLSLLIVLVAVLGISAFLGVFSPTPEKKMVENPPVVQASDVFLIAPKLGNVTRVRLEVPERGTMVFEKKGETWQIVEPVAAPAISWEVTDLVAAFESARKLETFNAGKDVSLQDAGLDKPTCTITLEEKDRKVTLLVGKNVVASENTYVKTSDSDQISVVDQNLKSKIKKDLSAYRDKQLWDLKIEKISELKFASRDGKSFNLVKGDDGQWVMLAPVRAKGSADPIISAVNALSTLRIEEFTDDKPANLTAFGLDKPAWTITAVETETVAPATKSATTKPAVKRTEHTILVGNQTGLKSDQVFAKLTDKNWVVTIKDADIRKFLPDTVAWRNKKVLDMDRNEITNVQIRHSGQEIVLAKVDQTWKLLDGNQDTADVKAVDAVLGLLTNLEAASFIDQPDKRFFQKSKLDFPACTVKITGGKKVEPIELTVGETTPSGMFRYVKRNGQDYVAAVSNDKLTPLFKSPLTYRSKSMIAFNLDHVKSLEITRGKETYKLDRKHQSQPWTLTAPIEAPADQTAVRDLLLSMTTLEATDFVGKGNLPAYNLGKPQIVVKFTTETPIPTTTTSGPAAKSIVRDYVLAASKHDGKYYAVRPDAEEPIVAQVSESFFKTISAELLDRRVFTSLPAQSIDRVEIKRPGSDPMIFEKSEGKWTFPADPVFPVDKDKLEQIISAMAQVKAVKFIEFQPTDKYGLRSPHLKISVSAGKNEWTLNMGQKTEKDNRYARGSEKDWVFELSIDDYAKFDKQLKDLAQQPAANPAAEPVSVN